MLKNEILKIPNNVDNIVSERLKEFSKFRNKNKKYWFSELCFCILTANSKAETAIKIQKEIGFRGFNELNYNELSGIIKRNKHRFHNNKSRYIIDAREHVNVKEKIKNLYSQEAREWLVNNVKGIGYKEASHFLRNVGRNDVAILDRHILKSMYEFGYINEMPKSLTWNKYFEIEGKFNAIAKGLSLSPSELDLKMWYLKTGKVLK